MRLAAPLATLCVALASAGCGSGSGGSSSTAPPAGAGPARDAAAPKKATSPNAPAGSRVVVCGEGATRTMGLRATAVDCRTARQTMRLWGGSHACVTSANAARGSCSIGDFRCQAVRTGSDAAVSCAGRGGDVAFLAAVEPIRPPRSH